MADKNTDYITLQNFLKKEGIVQTGGEAKIVIQSGLVQVNHEIEMQRGKKLRVGDEVIYQEKKYVVKDVH